jgi:rSAM/selenodomain-associated transferase 2
MPAAISIIIPTLNEEECLGKTLAHLHGVSDVEIIVVDGGSTDSTRQVARDFGVRVLASACGRAVQMNTGAAAAGGAIYLFLHADSLLPVGFVDNILRTLAKSGVAAGAFRLHIDGGDRRLRFIEQFVLLRSVFLRLPYGDQAIFLTASMFDSIGGYPVQPLMEDYELVRRLRRRGRLEILPQAVTTSARRWRQLGIVQTTLLNQMIVFAYLAGVAPERLARWYRGKAGPGGYR